MNLEARLKELLYELQANPQKSRERAILTTELEKLVAWVVYHQL
jgi:hypothetical protein